MPVVRDGKNLVGGYRDGKQLLSVYIGSNELWTLADPIAFDAVSSATPGTGNRSWQHDNAIAGSDVLIVINTSGNDQTTSVTYDGVAASKLGEIPYNNVSSNGRLYLYRATEAPEGESTVQVQKSGFGWVMACAVSVTGVGSVGLVSTTYGTGTNLLQGPLEVPAGGMVVQAFAARGDTLDSPFANVSGGTNRYNAHSGGGRTALSVSTAESMATFSAEIQSSPWSGVAVVLEPEVEAVRRSPTATLTESTLTSLTVEVNGVPDGFGPLAGWNFYLDGVKHNTTVHRFREYTFDGLTSGTVYEVVVKAVDTNSQESDPYPPLITSTITDTTMAQADRDAIDAIVTGAMAADKQPGISISIRSPIGDYDRAYGNGNHAPATPLSLNDHFRMFSVTKSFTATAVLQQIDAGNLDLSDTVEQYVPGVPNGTLITVEHLLKMRAGLPSYDTGDIALMFYLNPMLDYDEHDALVDIKASAPQFPPGTDYLYSNSNYILLGFILEAVTGRNIRDILADDVIAPAGLTRTTWPDDHTMPEPYARGYMTGMFGGQGWRTEMNPDFLGAAGGLVTTIDDLRRWGEELRDGALLSPTSHALRESLFCPVPYSMFGPDEFGYGLGYISFGSWFGHDGSYPGYECCVFYEPVSGAVIATMGNFQTPTLSVFSRVFAEIADYLYPGSLVSPGYPNCS